jgi:hypothetical protein
MGTDSEGAAAELQAVLQRLILAGRANTAAAIRRIEAIDQELREALSLKAARRGAVLDDGS